MDNRYSVEPVTKDVVAEQPEKVNGDPSHVVQITSSSGPHDSSLTLLTLKELSNSRGNSLEYQPGAGSTPELLLPSDLPLLDGFVTDLPGKDHAEILFLNVFGIVVYFVCVFHIPFIICCCLPRSFTQYDF